MAPHKQDLEKEEKKRKQEEEQEEAAEGAVVLLDSSQEEGPKPGQEGDDLGQSKEAEDLRAACALLKKAKAAYKKKQEQQSPGRVQQPAQSSLDTFWSPEKVLEPPSLQDVSPAQTPGPSPHWLVAAQQEVPVLAVKEEALVKAALEGPEPGTLVKKQRKPGSGRPRLPEEEKKARREEKLRQEEEKRKELNLSKRQYQKLQKTQQGPLRVELNKEEQKAFAKWLLAKVEEPGLTTTLLYSKAKED